MPEMTWEQATLLVLREAEEPLHYNEIAERILARGLKTTVGKTPNFTVAGEISKLRSSGTNIVKAAPGYYRLQDTKTVAAPISDTPDEDLDAVDAAQNLSIAAYGLHWERSKVNWNAGSILGYDIDPNQAINFADQQGVYLLHNWQAVVYVGKTSARERGLFQRLGEHHRKHVWSAKWERFSWFGIRRVSEAGELISATESASPQIVTALMEAVLIETLGPAFNQLGGLYMGTLYRQASN